MFVQREGALQGNYHIGALCRNRQFPPIKLSRAMQRRDFSKDVNRVVCWKQG